MTSKARIAELGEILATGYRRLRLSLDEERRSEAQCDHMVGAHESTRAGATR